MRFQKMFQREKGASNPPPTLGDTPPTTTPPKASDDNGMSFNAFDASAGWPCHRIAVGLGVVSGGTGLAQIRADLYVWDELSAHWYKVNQEPKYLVPNQIVFFDIVSLCRQPPTSGDLTSGSNGASGGAIDVRLVTLDDTNVPDGTYVFTMAPDATTIGADEPDINAPARRIRSVTPSDSVDLPDGPCRKLMVVATGTVSLVARDDDPSSGFVDLPSQTAGTVIDIETRRVRATHTGATVIALY
jgi:hypothetical protein